MTSSALVTKDRKHVVVERVLRRNRLVRFTDWSDQGGDDRGSRQTDDEPCGPADSCHGRSGSNEARMSLAAAEKSVNASEICCLLPRSPKASSRYASRTSVASAASAACRRSGGR